MFGSNPFGQSSASPFGSQPAFGQTNNATSNPFAPKPFGSTSPFASQTGGSIFGGMSTGVFGAPSSSSLGSTSVFGASSSPAFGSSTPTFGAPTGSAFGNSSSAFGGSSVFGQKPTFGGFGSTNTQSSPFGSSFQQSQPAFGSNLFGSSNPFGAPSQPAFGAASTPAFGGTSTPAFGSTTSPTFGSASGGFGLSSSPFGSSTLAFGSTSTPAFGAASTPAFGSTSTPAFGAASTPAFGAASTPAFGAASTPAFGSTSTPAFGAASTPAFGSTSTPAFGAASMPAFGSTSSPAFGSTNTSPFGAPSAPSFNFGSSPAFGQSSSAFGSNLFSTTSSFGQQTTSFGAQSTSPNFSGSGFGQSTFGGQRGGSRVTPYSPTPETDGATGAQTTGKLLSISAMPAYKDKSHEELRWEDYQQGDKGGPSTAGQAVSAGIFGSSGFGSTSTSAFGQSSTNLFPSSTSSNPFAPKTPAFSTGFGPTPTSAFGSSPFGASNTSSPFGSTAATPSLFGPSTQTFGGNTSSLFGSSSSSFGSPSIFGPTSTQGTTSAFGGGLTFGSTQSSPSFQLSTPSLTQTNSPFGQTSSAFGQTATGFGQSNMFGTPSTGFGGGLFSSTSSLFSNSTLGFGQTTPALSTQFQTAQPAQNTGGFNFNTFGQSQSAGTSIFGGTPGILGNSAFGQPSVSTQGPAYTQAVQIMNPFGSLPAMPMMSIGRTGTSPSIQYGISSLPVVDKPAPVRISSLLMSRHLSRSRIRLPVRKYHPKTDGPKLAFFDDDEETPSTPKADALFVPRENPRALIIRPIDQWPSRTSAEKMKERGNIVHENGKVHQDVNGSTNGNKNKGKAILTEDTEENSQAKDQASYVKLKESERAEGVHDGVPIEKEDSYITRTGHRAGEAAIVYEHGADIEALMPKLRHSDYYTEPRIHELAAKERAEPGFCRRVKDFVVGRHDCGSVKFLGETDVRRLDLESIIQFNYREVLAYMDETKKPPVGQGLNKPAEVTLLQVKCYDKKTGEQYTEGPKVDKYIGMLKKLTQDQGAEFVSYDPVRGEWKFRVSHFSVYKLEDDDAEDGDDAHGPIS